MFESVTLCSSLALSDRADPPVEVEAEGTSRMEVDTEGAAAARPELKLLDVFKLTLLFASSTGEEGAPDGDDDG